jgi:hypothetical protein
VTATYGRAEVLLHVNYDESWLEVRHAGLIFNVNESVRDLWPSSRIALLLAGVMQE